jgi:hypothetical protein
VGILLHHALQFERVRIERNRHLAFINYFNYKTKENDAKLI